MIKSFHFYYILMKNFPVFHRKKLFNFCFFNSPQFFIASNLSTSLYGFFVFGSQIFISYTFRAKRSFNLSSALMAHKHWIAIFRITFAFFARWGSRTTSFSINSAGGKNTSHLTFYGLFKIQTIISVQNDWGLHGIKKMFNAFFPA